jgi:hypothetical protein
VDEIFCSAKCEIFALWANIKEKSVRNARVSYAFNFIESFLLCKKLPSYFAKQNTSFIIREAYIIFCEAKYIIVKSRHGQTVSAFYSFSFLYFIAACR